MAQTITTQLRARRRPVERAVTDRVLTQAIQRRLDVPEGEAAAVARRLLALFGGKIMIEDEPLDKETRAFLYRLHAGGIVRTYTVERKNERGRQWLYFHWVVEPAHLRRIAERPVGREGPAAHVHEHHPAAPPPAVVG